MDDINAIVKKAKDNDEKSYELLLSKYSNLITKYSNIYSKMCVDAPGFEFDDMVSESKIALYNAIKNYDEDSGLTFGLFLKICIKNRLISCVRKAMSLKRKNLIHVPSQPYNGNDGNMYNVSSLIKGAKELLSKFEYQVFELHFINGQTIPELSVSLKKDVKSINNAIYRIRTKLKNLLNLIQ